MRRGRVKNVQGIPNDCTEIRRKPESKHYKLSHLASLYNNTFIDNTTSFIIIPKL